MSTDAIFETHDPAIDPLLIQGERGKSFLTGSGVPDVGIGFDGDVFADYLTGDLYNHIDGQWVKSEGNYFGGFIKIGERLAAEVVEDRRVVEAAVKAAETSVGLSKKWAENPADLPVIDDQYSALHWATKTKDTGEAAISAIADAKTDALTAIGTDKDVALTEITTKGEIALTAISDDKATALADIGDEKESALTGISEAKEGSLTDIDAAKSDTLEKIEVGVLAVEELSRLAGISASEARDDRVQTGLDVTQTSQDRSAVEQGKRDVEAALEIIRTEYVVYVIQPAGTPIPTGQYLATASGIATGIFDRMVLKVPTGSVSVQLVINGVPRPDIYTVTNAAPIVLNGLSIAITQGDTVSFAVLIGTASQLWAQITGLLK